MFYGFSIGMVIGIGDRDPYAGLVMAAMALLFLPLAFMMGGLQALLAGLASAWQLRRDGIAGYPLPLAAALLGGAVYAWRNGEDPLHSAIMVATHAVAALCCTAVLRAYLGTRSGSS